MASEHSHSVGSYFVRKYYHVLRVEPDKVYQFYTEKSTMLGIDKGKQETASALPKIQSLIKSLNFSGVKIKTIDSLDSCNEGILVMVSGSVQPKDYDRRRNFIQTFFLASQEKGYYVLSDIFHFLDEENIHKQQAAILANNILIQK